MKTNYNRFTLLTSGLAVGVVLLSVACGSDKKDNPIPSSGVGGGSATGGSSSTAGASATDTGGTTAGGHSSSSTGGAVSAGGACVQDPTKTDCISCPTTNDEFLNACSGAGCQPFDNAAKSVPSPLPAIP